MTELQAIKKSITHWKKMIKWVKKQKSKEKPDLNKMHYAIKEHWYGSYCPLCKIANREYGCNACILNKKHGPCDNSVWKKVNNSNTWSSWLKYAKKMLKQLEGLLPKRKKET